ncbi:MAG: Fe-S cluster assembly protein HesB [Candidatus Sumerlaeota bacterium]|nr:Fe-S cluster assembly protein HesB [Candidatus Sumerlaeota bacterium]
MKIEIKLCGGGGEAVNLPRTLMSHGVGYLPPFFINGSAPSLTATLALGHAVRTVVIAPGRKGYAAIRVKGPAPGAAMSARILGEARHVLRLDDDLLEFYAMARLDPALAWAAAGAGRMIRCQTVFEEIVKTICTTNCAWSATVRMVSALVEHLGGPAPGAAKSGAAGRAFPTPEAMAGAREGFYRDVARAGYRGAYLMSLAHAVADGSIALDELECDAPAPLCDDEVERRLLQLPGVGPYAAAHIMMMMGRYSRLILDSWTRPAYASLVGRKTVSDAAIRRRFRPYGRYAGLAFWLFLTRDWVEEENQS